jgi:predicted metalloprotease
MTHRELRGAIGLIVLLTVLGLAVAACGGGASNESGGEAANEEAAEEKPPGGTTAAGESAFEETVEGTAAGGREALAELPRFPPAPRDPEVPRFRGSQEVTIEEFARYVVEDANAKWQGIFEEAGVPYSPSGFVAYDQPISVAEGCGSDESGTVLDPAVGPAYCVVEQTVYFPTNWESSSGKSYADYGDFVVAENAAHEVGHHVQQQLGIREDQARGIYTSLQTELQAQCFAGVWGYSAYYEDMIEPGDIDEAIAFQAEAGNAHPDTHGTPEEQTEWFLVGYDYGDPVRCLELTPSPEEQYSSPGGDRIVP